MPENNDSVKAQLVALLESSPDKRKDLIVSIPSSYWTIRLDDGWNPIEELFRENHFYTLGLIFKSLESDKKLSKYLLEAFCLPLISSSSQVEFCLKIVDGKKFTANTIDKVTEFHATTIGDEKDKLLKQIENRLWLIDWNYGDSKEDDEDEACEVRSFLEHLLFLHSPVLLQKTLQFLINTRGIEYAVELIKRQLGDRLNCVLNDYVFLRTFLLACLPTSGLNLLDTFHLRMNWSWKINQVFEVLYDALHSPLPVHYAAFHKNSCVLKVLGEGGYDFTKNDADGKLPLSTLPPMLCLDILRFVHAPYPEHGEIHKKAVEEKKAQISAARAGFITGPVKGRRPRGGSGGTSSSTASDAPKVGGKRSGEEIVEPLRGGRPRIARDEEAAETLLSLGFPA